MILLFAFVPAGQGWVAFDRLVQVVSAFGTLAAVGVALWLGLKTSKEAQKRDYDAAVILAAGMVDLLEQGIDRLSRSIATVAFTSEDAGATDDERDSELDFQLATLKSALNAPLFDHGFETLSKLAPLPGACAVRIYKARSMLRVLSHEINHFDQARAWSGMSTLQKKESLLAWTSRAWKAVRSFQTVVGILHKVASDAGAEPTSEEIYGSDDDG